MTVLDDQLARVAERAARAGGTYLASAFRTGPIAGEYGPEDVRAGVDREAERRVLAVIRETFPDHAIHTEESGHATHTEEPGHAGGDSDYRWFVDPLDGTNNFASGLPTFATAVAVREGGRTRVAAIHEPIVDDLYLAQRGQGATVDGEPIHAGSDVPLKHGTVGLAVGLAAVRDPALRAEAERVGRVVGEHCKRVLETWAPCVDWGLLARGGIEGLVALYPPAHERHAGELLAAESGVAQATVPFDPGTGGDRDRSGGMLDDGRGHKSDDDWAEKPNADWDGEGLYVGASDERTLAELLAIVREE